MLLSRNENKVNEFCVRSPSVSEGNLPNLAPHRSGFGHVAVIVCEV